jgi:hypothetical protein
MWSKQIFWYKLSSFSPLKNTVLPRFRVLNVNIFLRTVFQIKAFNLFFIMEFTSWKYLVTFKSYTNKRTENTCPGFPPLKNTVLPRFRVSNVNIFFKTLYQVKALNIFFIVEFTSWKYLIPFKSYTYKRTGKHLSWF